MTQSRIDWRGQQNRRFSSFAVHAVQTTGEESRLPAGIWPSLFHIMPVVMLVGPWCANLISPYWRWARKFIPNVQAVGKHIQALNILVTAGCKPNVVGFLLFCFSASPPIGEQGWERLKDSQVSSIGKMSEIGVLLTRAAAIIRELDSNPATEVSKTMRYVLSDDENTLDKPMADVLDEAANLMQVGAEFQAFFKSDKQVLPDFWMFVLETYILETTQIEHYPEISELLVPAFEAHGRLEEKPEYDPRSVARIVERFRLYFDGSTRHNPEGFATFNAHQILKLLDTHSRHRNAFQPSRRAKRK